MQQKGKLHIKIVVSGRHNTRNFQIKPLIDRCIWFLFLHTRYWWVSQCNGGGRESQCRWLLKAWIALYWCIAELSGPVTQQRQAVIAIHYLASRPKAWEEMKLLLMIKLCDEFNCHALSFMYLQQNALQQITDAKHRGITAYRRNLSALFVL